MICSRLRLISGRVPLRHPAPADALTRAAEWACFSTTVDDEAGLRRLSAQLKTGKVVMKLFLRRSEDEFKRLLLDVQDV
jgi:hypothetical protein